MLAAERVTRLSQGLTEAQETISPFYDEVLSEVHQTISAAGSAGKSDIAVISFWKRMRADTVWVPRLLGLPDFEIRKVTSQAIATARDGDSSAAAGQAREVLRSLPGFPHGTALASALLTAAFPEKFAVYDTRAHTGLKRVGLDLPDRSPLFYARYMRLIENCRTEAASMGHAWSARDVDLALFILGKR